MSAVRHWATRTTTHTVVWVALLTNVVVTTGGVRLGAQSDGALSPPAWSYLSLSGWAMGVAMLGVPLVGDLRSGYGLLVAVRARGLRSHVTGAVLGGAGATVAVAVPAAAGAALADQLFRPAVASFSARAILVSALGLAALGGSSVAVTGLAAVVAGFSRAVSGACSIAVLFLGELLLPPQVRPGSMMHPTTPNATGLLWWTAVGCGLVVLLRVATGRRSARLAL